MNSIELDECYEFVKKLVLDCGEILKVGFKNPGKVTTKQGAHDLGLFVKFIWLRKTNIITFSYFLRRWNREDSYQRNKSEISKPQV